ncbi:MaoC family dehydratase N-terminal domain-containing protein [Chloroflexota bacterium]
MDEGSKAIETLKKAVGVLRTPEFPPEEVEEWAINRYLEVTEDTNPLWVDNEYAKKSRWGSVITPPTFVEMFSSLYRQWRRTPAPSTFLTPPFPYNFGAGTLYEFFVPVRKGDIISATCFLSEVTERRGSSGGRLAIIRYDKEYRNQIGELVSRSRLSQVSVEARSHRKAAPATLPPKETDVEPAEKPTGQVCFEDVEVGDRIPSLMKTFDVTTLCRWMYTMGFLAPMHYNYDYTTIEAGLPNLIVQGPLSNSYLARMVNHWIGGWGMLKSLHSDFRGVILIHIPITFAGRITDKYVKDGENFVELQVWSEHPEGWILTHGKATVTLPARADVPGR